MHYSLEKPLTGYRTRKMDDIDYSADFELQRPRTREDATRALEKQLHWLDTPQVSSDRKPGHGVIFIGLDDPTAKAMGFDALVIWCARHGLSMALCPRTRMVGLYRDQTVH